MDVNGRHELGWTALQVAAVNCRREIVTLLLQHGANPDTEDEFMNVYTTARLDYPYQSFSHWMS